MLTGTQVRAACDLLRWNRYDLQRRTSLPLYVVDYVTGCEDEIEATLAREIVLKDTFRHAEVEFTPDGPRLRQGQV